MLRQTLALFRNSGAIEAADRIIGAVTSAARTPDLYGEDRTPDTLDGRFELMTAFASVAVLRLRASPEGEKVGQIFVDRLFRFFDAGLREAGVGDLTVPKRMRKLAGVFYGRLGAYEQALADPQALAAALARNVWGRDRHPFAPELAGRLQALSARLSGLTPAALEEPQNWT